MDRHAELIEACPWREAFAVLGPALGDAEHELADAADAGRAQAWRLNGGEAYLLTRLEVPGPELVLVAAVGRGVEAIMPLLQARAAAQGARSIRFHARNPALGRLARRHGFAEAERVYRVNLDGR